MKNWLLYFSTADTRKRFLKFIWVLFSNHWIILFSFLKHFLLCITWLTSNELGLFSLHDDHMFSYLRHTDILHYTIGEKESLSGTMNSNPTKQTDLIIMILMRKYCHFVFHYSIIPKLTIFNIFNFPFGLYFPYLRNVQMYFFLLYSYTASHTNNHE